MTTNNLNEITGITDKLEKDCINTIRFLAVDGVQKANSGHPGMPMEASPLAYLLWTRTMNYNPKNPEWPNRDRFVLSAGHGSMLLYSMLHLTGYGLSLDALKDFRQLDSPTPGHPEYGCAPGVETTTGPLGQGFATGIGMAMAERYLATRFNRPDFPLVNHFIYALVSDGDMMEGISSETASMAGDLGLGKLIYVYLDNKITIEGNTHITFTEDVARRFEAYNWQVQRVDGYDLPAINTALANAKSETSQPSLIIARTHIAWGSPNKQDTPDAHGAPLGEEEVLLTKKNCGWPETPNFWVPKDVLSVFRQALKQGEALEKEWQALYANYQMKYSHLAQQWEAMHKAPDTSKFNDALPHFDADQGSIATRKASGQVLAAVKPHLPGLVGGSADLAPSNNTYLKGFDEFKEDGGPNIRFGIREHGMGAILNGMALSKALIPYGGTFLVFSDYMRPAIRMAALMQLHIIYVFTHDSIGLGEDGPTHQPIEHLASLRSIPNILVVRPADAQETVEAWKLALAHQKGPCALILSRQGLPVIDRKKYASAEGLHNGAYVLAQSTGGKPDLILMATGAEVHLILGAYEQLASRGVRVRLVNIPSWELFSAMPGAYRHEVLPPDVSARIAVEAGSPLGWERFTGSQGIIIGMHRFGASAPAKDLFKTFGFTVEAVIEKAEKLLGL
ncbi:MAG: transketolase [Deltaproteobacteria bacterium]|jgi:transketolase|nr:transketolase [Deltaproteobacteria bacterium]